MPATQKSKGGETPHGALAELRPAAPSPKEPYTLYPVAPSPKEPYILYPVASSPNLRNPIPCTQ